MKVPPNVLYSRPDQEILIVQRLKEIGVEVIAAEGQVEREALSGQAHFALKKGGAVSFDKVRLS